MFRKKWITYQNKKQTNNFFCFANKTKKQVSTHLRSLRSYARVGLLRTGGGAGSVGRQSESAFYRNKIRQE